MLTNTLKQDLGGAWQFQQARDARPSGAWLPATVPGNVHTDLMAAGELDDPHLAQNEALVGWVEGSDWFYRRSFTVDPAILEAGAVQMVAEGLDTWCSLWLNGKPLGATETMFVEHSFNVTGRLKPGKNELLLRFFSPKHTLEALEKKHGYVPAIGDEQRSHGRKAQYSFGWDWGPRLATSGVFMPIYLEALPPAQIRDLYCRTFKASAAEARGELVLEIAAVKAMSLPLTGRLGRWQVEKTVRLKKGLNTVRLPWKMDQPRLWWPRGYGEAALYLAEATLGGLSRASVISGIRTVELEQKKDAAGQSFGFKVNGVPVYAKGANWIPADSFLGRVTPQRITGLIQAAVDANYTMLRVWGGGIFESEDFYAECDRQGLLVWQDFPFACNEVPEHPDFLKLVKAEGEKAVRRLRRHPSLALWCGNNENHTGRHDHWYRGREAKAWGAKIYHSVLPELCQRLDPDRPYVPGSPLGGKDPNSQTHGDRHHWLVWAQFLDYDAYRADRSRFISEFGFAALPNRGVLKRAVPPKDRWLQSRSLAMHDKVERGGAYARIAYYILQNLPMAMGLDKFRYLSQVNQARALRIGVEQWRRNKPHTQGALVWQHNDCWPVTSWAVLDGDDTPKLAWHGLREAYADVLLSSVEADAKLLTDLVGRLPLRAQDETGRPEAWLTLDGRTPFSGTLSIERWDMHGKQAGLGRVAVKQSANTSKRLWARDRRACGIKDPSREYLVFTLKGKDGSVRISTLFFERPKRLELPETGLVVGAREHEEHVDVAVSTKKLALAVELHAPVPGKFSQNGFDLLPGETRQLRFTPDKPGKIKGAWQVLTLNQMQREARRG